VNTGESREELIQEMKIYAIIAPTILPIIEKRKKEAQGRLIQSYRSGRVDNLTIVAELSVLSDLENEINQKRNIYDTLAGEPNGNRK
jgi:hypothetical protein